MKTFTIQPLSGSLLRPVQIDAEDGRDAVISFAEHLGVIIVWATGYGNTDRIMLGNGRQYAVYCDADPTTVPFHCEETAGV